MKTKKKTLDWSFQAIISWCVLIAVAFVEGVFRTLLLEPRLPRMATEIIGISLVLVAGYLIACWYIRRGRFPDSMPKLLFVGVIWVALTVIFEFVFFGAIMGTPTATLLANYNLADGNLFSLGLLITIFVPWLATTTTQTQ